MSDYNTNYTLAKDTAKTVQLYHHEQVPFHSFSRPMHTMANLASPPMKQDMPTQNPASGDLQDIIYSYQSQPELLKLILLRT
ncbi:hypothetical protein EDC96DRAFT_505612 [Choanephora cucurbitarum]|nr:hypothetical protein EDC96DRAFT_505612 [Choanephora cucurbitarum]